MLHSGSNRRRILTRGLCLGAAVSTGLPGTGSAVSASPTAAGAQVRHARVKVGPVDVFYREAGLEGAPVLLLLHGFANSSHYFRHLIPRLAHRFHLVAPDLPLFGFTKVLDDVGYVFDFAHLTETVARFVDAIGLRRFGIYVFDYGAPIGFNIAISDPDRITAIVSQNGNIYEEGLGHDAWAPLFSYWHSPSEHLKMQIRQRMTLDGVREAYFHGVPDPAVIEPEAYWLDAALLDRPGNKDQQVALKLDYKINIDNYKRYQGFLRERLPPLLAIWGENDAFFTPPGAQAFKRDVPSADVRLLDTGHFALETNLDQIASAILAMPVWT